MSSIFHLQDAELEARREQERMEEYKRQIIEEERQRLLKEHASKLLGFLPKVGVLEHVHSRVRYDYSRLSSSLAVSGMVRGGCIHIWGLGCI